MPRSFPSKPTHISSFSTIILFPFQSDLLTYRHGGGPARLAETWLPAVMCHACLTQPFSTLILMLATVIGRAAVFTRYPHRPCRRVTAVSTCLLSKGIG